MIQTPCVGVCRINDQYLVCEGCYRTRLQIAKWHKSTDQEKQAILVSIEIKKSILNADN